MIIAAEYAFNGGEVVRNDYEQLVVEIESVISEVDAPSLKSKVSEEITMPGKVLYSPKGLNLAYANGFESRGWGRNIRIQSEYPTQYYRPSYSPRKRIRNGYREMDFLKQRLGVEVQFGKYAFMVYNVCAKMTIFSNLGYIDVGVEIVPVKGFADEMSSGVSYFEQFVWDLEQRGVADIDIPVLILGIDK
ncbi:MAG: BglII/BstYI family type II restriction endonuclease [Caldilineaceae bacterium]|nr:BglII/BstYI family type II restriction endonuclease [Caldilineaceae bacterium]